MKKFLKNIWQSIYSKDYYKELITRPFSYSVKYYLLFSLLMAIIGTLLAVPYIIQLKPFFNLFTENLIQHYPDKLEIVIKNGQASSNMVEPYFIKYPVEWKKQAEDSGRAAYDNFLVINTKNSVSLDDFSNYKTLCLLTKDKLVCQEEKNSIKVSTLSSMPDIIINKAFVISLVDKFRPFIAVIYPIAGFIVLVVLFVVGMLKFAYLLVGALLIWLVAKIRKHKIDYKKSYQLGLHLITLPIILIYFNRFVLGLLGYNLNFTFLFTIILIIVAVINIRPNSEIMTPTISTSV